MKKTWQTGVSALLKITSRADTPVCPSGTGSQVHIERAGLVEDILNRIINSPNGVAVLGGDGVLVIRPHVFLRQTARTHDRKRNTIGSEKAKRPMPMAVQPQADAAAEPRRQSENRDRSERAKNLLARRRAGTPDSASPGSEDPGSDGAAESPTEPIARLPPDRGVPG